MILQKQEKDAVVITVLRAFMDDRSTEGFETAYRPLLAATKKIVVDLNDLDYIDSSHLAALVVLYKRVVQGGGTLVFTGLRQTVRDTLLVTRLDKVFQLAATRKEALELLQKA